MGLITKFNSVKNELISDFKKGRAEKAEFKKQENVHYKEAYQKERIKTLTREAKLDARAGGKLNRIVKGFGASVKQSLEKNKKLKKNNPSTNPWRSNTVNKNNPWR